MFINNQYIDKYHSFLVSYQIGVMNEVINLGQFKNKYIKEGKGIEGFPIDLKIGIKGNDLEELEERISCLVANLNNSQIKFKDSLFYYDVIITSTNINEYSFDIMEDKEMTTLEFTLFANDKYENKTSTTISNNDIITLQSTAKTPVKLELIPNENVEEIGIKGFGEDITVKNLTKDKKVIIDGEKGLVTEEGQNKWNDYDSWGFPKLSPGENEISISEDIEITAIYSPRWL